MHFVTTKKTAMVKRYYYIAESFEGENVHELVEIGYFMEITFMDCTITRAAYCPLYPKTFMEIHSLIGTKQRTPESFTLYSK